MYLTLTINPSIDYFVDLPSGVTLVTGSEDAPAVNRSKSESFEAGGKGINVAKVLNRLGGKGSVTATGFTAGFTGAEISRNVESEGIVSRFIEVAGHSRINMKVKDGHGIETEINGAGPEIAPGDITRLINTICQTEFDTLFISGSLPASCQTDTYALIIKAVLEQDPSVRIITDCEGEAMLKCLPLKPYLIKPNAHELARLTGMDITTSSSLPELRAAADRLISWGAQNVLVSLGGNGACLLTGDGVFLQSSGISGDVVSTIGAGDTMIASFIYMLDRSHDYRKALDFSNACAARAAFGQGLPSASVLSEIIKEFS